MVDGIKRRRRQFDPATGHKDIARTQWYAIHRSKRFSKRFGI